MEVPEHPEQHDAAPVNAPVITKNDFAGSCDSGPGHRGIIRAFPPPPTNNLSLITSGVEKIFS